MHLTSNRHAIPPALQRRRTAEDELNMRALYGEGDLISAEVQSFYADGAVALHTRSLKYGKVRGVVTAACMWLLARMQQP